MSYVHGVTSAIQTQLDTCIKNNNTTTLTGNINLVNSDSNTFTFAGATPTELGYIHGVTSDIQTQLDNCIKKAGNTELSGNVQLTGPYTFNGATPSELSYLSGVTSAIQTQLNNKQVSGSYATTADLSAQFSSLTTNYTTADTVITAAYIAADTALSATLTTAYTTAIANKTDFTTLTKNNADVLTAIPASVIQQGTNTLTSNVAFTGAYTIAGATPTEISRLSGVSSNVQTQLDSTIKRGGTTALSSNVVLSGTYTFSGATPTEITYLSGVTSAIQTQLNNKLSSSGGTITGSISCTGLTDSGTMTSGKHGVNLGTGNAPSNYVDIVIPTGSTTHALNIANTFGGVPVAYIDVAGNGVVQAFYCTQLNVTTYGIVLPTTYPSILGAGYLGYIKPTVTCTAQALTTATLVNMGAILLTAGVWDIRAVAVFGTTSGTNTTVTMVSGAISTNTTTNDDVTSQVRIPTMNFSFGATQDTYVYLPISRVIQITSATYNMNLNVKAWFTGSLSCTALTQLYAVRIA